MENNKNKKSVKFQGDMLNFCDFIQVFVFTRNHHLNDKISLFPPKFEAFMLQYKTKIYNQLEEVERKKFQEKFPSM